MKPDIGKLEYAGFTDTEVRDGALYAAPPNEHAAREIALLDANGDMQLFPQRSHIHKKIAQAHGLATE